MSFRIFAFGSNGSGQLGVGHSVDTAEPQLCLFSDAQVDLDDARGGNDADKRALLDSQQGRQGLEGRVAKIVAGGNHTLILTSRGEVWAAGRNDDGRCGLPVVSRQVERFHQVEIGRSIDVGVAVVTHVAAMWAASIFVVGGTMVFSCGTGEKGELGLGQGVDRSAELSKVLNLTSASEKVQRVVAGVNHVLVLTSVGELYGWGSSRKGQLGDATKKEVTVWSPRKIDVPFGVRGVVAGRDFTFIWGVDDEQLFLGDDRHFVGGVRVPLKAEENEVSCGWSNIYHHSASGLGGIGRTDRGQLPCTPLPTLRHFAAGSEHCIACTVDGKVIAWGWGEHGNCGSPVDERGMVSQKFNHIPLQVESGENIAQVVAGCATSFVTLDRYSEHEPA